MEHHFPRPTDCYPGFNRLWGQAWAAGFIYIYIYICRLSYDCGCQPSGNKHFVNQGHQISNKSVFLLCDFRYVSFHILPDSLWDEGSSFFYSFTQAGITSAHWAGVLLVLSRGWNEKRGPERKSWRWRVLMAVGSRHLAVKPDLLWLTCSGLATRPTGRRPAIIT